MPFNFLTMNHYKIDYDKLFREVNSKPILRDKEMQFQLINKWINVLKEADKKITKQLSTERNIENLKKLMLEEPEAFQLPMHHDGNDIFLHFRISKIKESLNSSINQYSEFDISQIIAGKINWSSIELDKNYRPNLNHPIIIIPFLNNEYDYLVIDGNHRISYCVNNNIKKIRVLCLEEEFVKENAIFSTEFDRFYYIFMNEMSHMAINNRKSNFNHFSGEKFLRKNSLKKKILKIFKFISKG